MYKELNDNEIIYMIQEDDRNVDILLEKYRPIIINICKKYLKLGASVGLEFDDLKQIANIALINSIKYYKDSHKTLFFTYVIKCVENNIKIEIRKELTYRKRTLNNAISLDEIVSGNDLTLYDVIKDTKATNPIDYLILEEEQIKYINFVNSLPLEIAIAYEMRNGGCTNVEISKYLNVDNNTINKYIAYARNKSRLCLN